MNLILVLTALVLLIELPCIAQNSHDAKQFWKLAIKAQKEKSYDKAIEYYKKSLQLEPDAVVYFNLGTAYQADQSFDLAIEAYQTAMKLREQSSQEPSFINLYHGLATSYQSKNNLDEAYRYYDLLAQNLSGNLDGLPKVTLCDVYCQLADIRQQKKDPNGALEMYKKALELTQPGAKNDRASIASHIAYLSQMTNKNREAEQYYEKALEDKPQWQTYYNLGTAMQASGTNAMALDNYEKALCLLHETSPSMRGTTDRGADMYYGLATIHDVNKDYEKALHNYKLALEYAGKKDLIHPSDICFCIGRVYQHLGCRRQAAEYFKRAVKLRETSPDIKRSVTNQQLYVSLAKASINPRLSRKWLKLSTESADSR